MPYASWNKNLGVFFTEPIRQRDKKKVWPEARCIFCGSKFRYPPTQVPAPAECLDCGRKHMVERPKTPNLEA